MACNFTSFSIVFQSHPSGSKVIMKGYVQWIPIYDWKYFHLKQVSNLGQLEQQLSASPTDSWGSTIIVLN